MTHNLWPLWNQSHHWSAISFRNSSSIQPSSELCLGSPTSSKDGMVILVSLQPLWLSSHLTKKDENGNRKTKMLLMSSRKGWMEKLRHKKSLWRQIPPNLQQAAYLINAQSHTWSNSLLSSAGNLIQRSCDNVLLSTKCSQWLCPENLAALPTGHFVWPIHGQWVCQFLPQTALSGSELSQMRTTTVKV